MESTVENILILTLGTGLNIDRDTDKELTQQGGLSEEKKENAGYILF